MIVAIDGMIVPPERATISVLDRGLLYGDGAFEILRTWNGRPVELDRHLDRLADTATTLRLTIDRAAIAAAVGAVSDRAIDRLDRQPSQVAIDEMRRFAERVNEVMPLTIDRAHPDLDAFSDEMRSRERIAAAMTGVADVRVRIVVTRGPGPLSARLDAISGGRTIVIAEPIVFVPPFASLVTVDVPVVRRGRGHKTLAYLDHLLARELAREVGGDEALRLDADGHVAEGATSNIFAVIGDTVVTPPVEAGVLPGIVRGRVLELHPVEVRPLSRRELATADELFLTSSIRGIVGVNCLDGQDRAVGPVTTRIAHAYAACMLALATI